MVIIDTDPWKEDDPKEADAVSVKSDEYLFGFQDLASDYYQVLRQRSRPKFCRVLWGITIFFLFGFTSYMVYKLLYDFFQYDSYNKSMTKWKRNVTLPAISICGTNFINYTRLQTELEDDSTTADLLGEFDGLLTELTLFSKDGNVLDAVDFEQYLELLEWEAEKGSIAVRFRSGIYDMLVGEYDYYFQGVGNVIETRAKSVGPTELGMCLELNDNGKMKQTFNGVNGGLTVDLDAKVIDYLFTTPTKGFVIFIRDQDETVMLSMGGHLVSPGTEAFLKLSARHVTRLGKPHGTCKNVLSPYSKFGKRHESVRECIQRQKIEAMVRTCGCIPWYFANRMAALKKWNVLDEFVGKIKALDEGYATDPPEDSEADKDASGNKDDVGPKPTEAGPTDKKRRKRSAMNFRDVFQRSKRSNIQEALPRSPRRSKREGPYTDAMATEWTPTAEPIYQSNYSTYVCTFSVQNACDSVVEHFIKVKEIEMKGCPEPCSYNEWDVDLTTTVFPPTQKYFDKFIKEYVYIDPPPDFTYARENMARIHVYYDDMKIDLLTQEKAYEPQNFIAEFGGTVDLFIGFSFFTIFQLIEIGIAACVYKFCTAKKAGRRPCSGDELPSLDERPLQPTCKTDTSQKETDQNDGYPIGKGDIKVEEKETIYANEALYANDTNENTRL